MTTIDSVYYFKMLALFKICFILMDLQIKAVMKYKLQNELGGFIIYLCGDDR